MQLCLSPRRRPHLLWTRRLRRSRNRRNQWRRPPRFVLQHPHLPFPANTLRKLHHRYAFVVCVIPSSATVPNEKVEQRIADSSIMHAPINISTARPTTAATTVRPATSVSTGSSKHATGASSAVNGISPASTVSHAKVEQRIAGHALIHAPFSASIARPTTSLIQMVKPAPVINYEASRRCTLLQASTPPTSQDIARTKPAEANRKEPILPAPLPQYRRTERNNGPANTSSSPMDPIEVERLRFFERIMWGCDWSS
ncbi:hypothetical protein PMAYCL1PPCAC_09520, partial [Pristionchus mayeri]